METEPTLDRRFEELRAQWRAITHPNRVPDESAFLRVRADAAKVRAAGGWVSGPADLLTILGRQRDELFHSRLLGWLLNPTGRHGLGNRFLRGLLDEVWAGELLVDSGTVAIELERTHSGVSDVTGEILEARADLVIRLETAVIVIENKLDAGEQPAQCERLYWSWAHEPLDVRWLYLTPTGRAPTSATSVEAQAAWRTISYLRVARTLSTTLAETERGQTVEGRASAQQYLATLMSRGRH